MKQPRKVIAFCSNRAGIGQSMVFASVAWLLETNGRRVVAIDWDLEEPSLPKHCAPFLTHDTLSVKFGLIDLLWEYAVIVRRASTSDLNDSHWGHLSRCRLTILPRNQTQRRPPVLKRSSRKSRSFRRLKPSTSEF
jgi:hypothetical protein